MNAVKQGNAVQESNAYNHRGERVLRTPAGGTAQITLYDEAGQWLGNYSATGQAQQQAIWLDNYPVALINVPATGVPELAYVQPDHLGTPRVVIDPARDVAIWEWSNKSEVFGNQLPSADPDGDGVAFELALRFPGPARRKPLPCAARSDKRKSNQSDRGSLRENHQECGLARSPIWRIGHYLNSTEEWCGGCANRWNRRRAESDHESAYGADDF